MRIIYTAITVLLLCATSNPKDPQFNIVVAIAEKQGVCEVSDVGFSVTSSYAEINKVKERATKRVKNMNPGYTSVRLYPNYDKKKHKGDYLVILSGTGLHDECLKNSFGVGFGKNSQKAMDNAKKDLKNQNKHWDGKYKVVRDEKVLPKS